MADTHVAWVQLCMTHLPGVAVAQEPDKGGIGLLMGPLLSCLPASQSLVTSPMTLPLGPLEIKGDIMRKPLGGMVGGPMFPSFHWGPLH
jgi:hypothetical protein